MYMMFRENYFLLLSILMCVTVKNRTRTFFLFTDVALNIEAMFEAKKLRFFSNTIFSLQPTVVRFVKSVSSPDSTI